NCSEIYFFFSSRRRHTRSKRDWSSDVCSSDLISNGLIGLAGGLISQNNGYADVNMGVGTIVIGLAAIIIGEVAYGELSLTARLVAVVVGSILYRFVLLIVLKLGFSTNDYKLLSAIILAFCLMLPLLQKKFHVNKVLKKGVERP